MSNFAKFDVRKWPTVYVNLKGSPKDVEEFEDYLQGFDMLYEKKRKFNLIVDASNLGKMSMYYVTRQAFHMHSSESKARKYVDRIGIVIVTKKITQLLNILFSMKKPACEVKIFKNIADAESWVFNR